MKPVLAVVGPRDPGPGEREEMLRRARELLEQAGVDGVERMDVPGRGAGEEGEGVLRAEVERIVPALQTGSLFGGRRGVLIVDAQALLKAEAEIIAELVPGVDGEAVVVCFVAAGSIPAPLGRIVTRHGDSHTVKAIRERDAADSVRRGAQARGLRLRPEAVAALVQRFGSDTGSLDRALDQLRAFGGDITADQIIARFRNRPDEPMWHYSDAVAAGNTGEALRRLADFLTHGHPLQLLAFLHSDLRRRSLAAAAPDVATLAEWLGAKPDHYPVKKAWAARGRTGEADLRKALDAIARADLALKTAPEAIHRPTMERLTVAMCRWYGRGR